MLMTSDPARLLHRMHPLIACARRRRRTTDSKIHQNGIGRRRRRCDPGAVDLRVVRDGVGHQSFITLMRVGVVNLLGVIITAGD